VAEPIKRGKSWFIQVRSKRHNFSESRSFRTKQEARAWRDEVERKLRVGASHFSTERTMRDLLERYRDEVKAGTSDVRRIDAILKTPISSVRLVDLRVTDFVEWRDLRLKAVTPESVRRDLVVLSGALSTAKREWLWLPDHPMTGLTWPQRGEPRSRLVTQEEMDRLKHVAGTDLSTLSSRAVAAFEFACLTGMRSGEIMAMRAENVWLDRGFIHVPRGKTRAARRDVPLVGVRVREILRDVLGLALVPAWGMSESSRDALFRKVVRQAGITDLHFHDSRHTAITRLSGQMELLPLARAVGITNLKTLLVYYNETAEQLSARLTAAAEAAAASASPAAAASASAVAAAPASAGAGPD
jgi:integrase